MAESNFVDYVKIYCRSGKGGRGSMHLRHVKYNPNGGPDGGDAQEAGCAVCAAVGAVREGAACNEGDRMGRGFRRKSRQTVPGTGGGAKTMTAAQSGNA